MKGYRHSILAIALSIAIFLNFAVVSFANTASFTSAYKPILETLAADAATEKSNVTELVEGRDYIISDIEFEIVSFEEAGIPTISAAQTMDAVDAFTLSASPLIVPNHSLGQSSSASAIAPYSTLADLKVENLRPSVTTSPLPTQRSITFYYTISNIGGANANNIYLSVYANGQLVQAPSNVGSLAAGVTNVRGEFNFGVMSPGSYTIKIVVNEGRTITESNYNNNSAHTDCVFDATAYVDLGAYKLDTANGTTTTECDKRTTYDEDGNVDQEGTYTTYRFHVANWASTNSPNGAPVQITVEGTPLLNTTLPPIEPGKAIIGRFNMQFFVQGSYRMGLHVDPNNILNDVDRDDNDLYQTFNITYDMETLSSKGYNNGTTITYTITDSAVYNYTTAARLAQGATKWNGIGSIAFASSASASGGIVEIYTYYNSNSNVSASAGSGPSGSSPYTHGILQINTNHHSALTDKTIIHEFGHVLGLAHPRCNNPAIMHQSSVPNISTNTIQEHDRYNVRNFYK